MKWRHAVGQAKSSSDAFSAYHQEVIHVQKIAEALHKQQLNEPEAAAEQPAIDTIPASESFWEIIWRTASEPSQQGICTRSPIVGCSWHGLMGRLAMDAPFVSSNVFNPFFTMLLVLRRILHWVAMHLRSHT